MKESQYEREVVCKWLRKAEKDLGAASLLLQEDFFGESAFHSQQAAEKALKAILIAIGQRPPRTHRLELLLELIARHSIDIENIRELDLGTLSDYAVEARYPDFGEEPSASEAQEALSIAGRVVEWAREKLGEIGVNC